MKRHRWLRLWPAGLLVVAGCSGSHEAAVAHRITSTSAPSTALTTLTTPGPSTVVAHPVISAVGSLLRPPTAPVTIPAEQDCHRLLTIPLASITACATAASPSGTITGTDEGVAHSQQWDVWKRRGNEADLVLTYRGNVQATPGFVFHSADVASDGDSKLLAVEHAPGVDLINAVDIIETNGVVVAHITVGTSGGVVGPEPDGGIGIWTAAGSTTDSASVIGYTSGAWRTISTSSVPAAQVPTYPDDDGFGGGLP
jgi:hypothetical protein